MAAYSHAHYAIDPWMLTEVQALKNRSGRGLQARLSRMVRFCVSDFASQGPLRWAGGDSLATADSRLQLRPHTGRL